jgi:transcriptional regulator with XRE-family HTH domain
MVLLRMKGASLVREARRRAGMSQSELAARTGTTQSAIARLECGRSSPSFRRVTELIEACGLELRVRLVEPDARGGVADAEGRLPDEIRSMLGALTAGGVAAVVIGDVAAALHHVPTERPTLTIVPDPSAANVVALATVLDGLGARARVEGGTLPFERDAATLASRGVWSLATSLGPLDLRRRPAGTDGYRDLARDAVPLSVDGIRVSVASLADVVRMLSADEAVDDDRLAMLRRALSRASE